MLSKVTDYLKNVGKSVVYAASDVIKEDNEFIADFANTNREVFTAAYSSVKNYRTTINKIESSFKSSKIYQAADIGMKAIFEDLKTGTFYNKARKEEIASKLGGFDLSDDFNIEEFEKGLEGKEISDGDKAVIDAVTKSTRQSGELVSDTVARSTSAIISNQRASDRILFTQNIQMISGIHAVAETTGLVGKTINNTNQMLKTMADNQKTFYEKTGKTVEQMRAMMQEILEMQRNLYNDQRNAQQNDKEKKRQKYTDIISANGTLDIREYIKNVKGNANRILSDKGLGMLVNGIGDNGNMLAQFAASPLEFIPKFFIKKLIPETTREITKQFNETLSGFFSTMIGKFNNMATKEGGSPIMQMIGDLLGIRIRTKTSLDTNKYTKGPVPFDGITRKAITEVIPGYLRRIEGALTGKREIGYDYEGGRFIDFAASAEAFKNNDAYFKALRSSISDFGNVIKKYTKNIQHSTLEEQDRFEGLINTVLSYIAANNGDWTKLTKKGGDDYRITLARELSAYKGNQKVRTSNGTVSDLTFDDDDVKKIQGILWEAMQSPEFKRAASGVANNAMTGKQRYTERMQDIESKGGQVLEVLADTFSNKHIDKYGAPKADSFAGLMLKARDKYNKDVFDYLRSLDDNSIWIKRFIEANAASYLPRGGNGTGGPTPPTIILPGGGTPPVVPTLIMPDMTVIQGERGTPTKTAEEKFKESIAKEAEKYADSANRNKNKNGITYIDSSQDGWYGSVVEHARRINIDDRLERDRQKAHKEPTFWQDIFGIDPNAKHNYDSKTFLEQIRAAQGIGEKYQVIQKAISKLAEAPMKMVEHTIKKADEAVYHFMFGRADDEVDEDGNPIKGLLAKTIHEMKLTFKKLNDWLNEKLLDPLKKKLDEWGIHSVTDALDKITGGRFSDAKNAIADTLLGTKGEDGRRTGGWADPFRKAFSYNWEVVSQRRAAEARAKKERDEARQRALAEMQAEEDFNSIYHAEGTAGRAKSDLFTMLSPGEELISPSGKSRTVTESESYSPHIVPKGTTIYNPQPKNVRKQQKALEQKKALDWARSMNFNADADQTGGLYNFERVNFKNEKAKSEFQEQYEYVDIYLEEKASELIASGTDEGIALGQEYLVLFEEFKKYKGYYPSIINPNPKGYGSEGKKYTQFINWIKKVYKALTTNNLKEAFYVEDQKAKQIKAKEPEKESQPEQVKNKWLHEQLDKLKYDEAKPENITRVNKIADTTAKATIGTGAGLLLGNPLLGLVGGAIAGIVKNNKAINEFIFGDIEHDNGLISKKTQQYMKEAIPTVKKTGIIGGIAGLVTGLGPIPGLLLGSAAGFAAKNEDLMETLFGPKEEREKKIEKMKKAMPRMGIGAAAGALLGPFGLLGGAALGAAGGLFTSTNTFKELLYGEVDEDGKPVKGEDGKYKGIVGALQTSFIDPLKEFANNVRTKARDFIRDKIVDPIAGAMKPIGAAMKHIVKDVLMAVPNALNWVFEKSFGIPMGEFLRDKVFGPIARFTKGFLKLPFTLFKGLLAAPGKIIGGIGNAIRGSQIRRGTADYMTAEERLAYREQHKTQFGHGILGHILHPFRARFGDKMLEEDENIAAMHVGDTVDENGNKVYGIESIINQIQQATTTEKQAGKAVRASQRGLNNIVDTYFRNHGLISTKNNKDKILKALNNGDLAGAMKLIEKLKTKDGKKLSGEELQEFQDEVTRGFNALEESKALRKAVGSRKGRDKSSMLAKIENDLKARGFKNVNLRSDRQRARILDLLKAEKTEKAGLYANNLSDNEKIEAMATVGAIQAQTDDLKLALEKLGDRLEILVNNPIGARDSSEGAAGVYRAFEDLEHGTDENGEPLMKTGLGRSFVRGISNSIEQDVYQSARTRYRVDARRHQRGRKDNNIIFGRITKIKEIGLEAKPTNDWSSKDKDVRAIFDLLSKKRKFDINKALSLRKQKNFVSNLIAAMENGNGKIVGKEFLDRIAKMGPSKTERECLDNCNKVKLFLFDSSKFTLDQIDAVLGASEKQLRHNTIMEVYKQLKKYVQTYGAAPEVEVIRSWYANLNQLRSDAKATDEYIEAENKKAKEKKKLERDKRRNGFTEGTSPEPAPIITPIPATSADADEGTENVPTEHVSWLKDKWREKIKPAFSNLGADIKEARADSKQLKQLRKNKNIGYELLIVKALHAIQKNTERSANSEENQEELEREKTKEEKKKEKKEKKANKKAREGNLWQRANARVEEFGENVREGGNNFLRALSHPVKMIKGAIHGSKKEYDEKKEGEKMSFIDLLHGIREGQKEQLEELKKKEEDGKIKEPIWKRIIKMIFGKSLATVAFRTLAIPLGVGLFKNQVWPLIKDKAWPWMYEKLLGDPNIEGDGLLGRLNTWFKGKVVPVLFGERNEDGVWTKGWFSGAANFWEQKAKPFLVGEDGESGLFGKIKNLFSNLGYILADTGRFVFSWLTNKDFSPNENNPLADIFGVHTFSATDQGSSGFLQTLVYNWADGLSTMVPFITKTLVSVLPKVLVGLFQGVVDGIASWFGKKKGEEAIQNHVDDAIYGNYTKKIGKGISINGGTAQKLIDIKTPDTAAIGGGGNIKEPSANAGSSSSVAFTSGDEYVNSAVNENGMVSLNKFGVDKELTEAEYEAHYSWIENLDDMELQEAIKEAQDNLVILPYSMFPDEESYREYFDNLFGEGSTARYGWDLIKCIDTPIIVDMNSDLYQTIVNTRSTGEVISEATFKLLVNAARGGVMGCKVVPALFRAGTATLNLLAKVPAPGLIGKLVKVPVKLLGKLGTGINSAVSGVTTGYKAATAATSKVAQATGQTFAATAKNLKVSEFTYEASKNAIKAVDAIDDATKVSKAPKWIQGITERFSQVLTKLTSSDNKFIQGIANICNKSSTAVRKLFTSSKIADLASKFGAWFAKTFPHLAEKIASGLLSKVAWVLTIAMIEIDYINGYFDAKTILGLRDDRELTDLDKVTAGLINIFCNQVLFGFVSACDITSWFVDNIMIGMFNAESEYIKSYQSVQKEYERYLEAHPEEGSISKEQFLDTFYPSAQTLAEKDLKEGNWGSLADHWVQGVQQIGKGIADWWNGLWGKGKEEADKVLDLSLPTIDTTKLGKDIQQSFGTGKHVDQRISNMRYNAPGDTEYQTVADSGCGPAAAVTVLNQYGKGKLEEAAKFSLSRGYKEPNGGTYPGFFGDYLGQNGIDTQYERDPNRIMGNLAEGKPVILMGTGNGSSSSPFEGANGSHYVTATGLDRNGNMIIEDPDDRRGGLKYNAKNVLNRTSIAISTNPGRGRRYGKARRTGSTLNGRYGKAKPLFGRGYTINQIDRDGLQDLRVWKDPGEGTTKKTYINNIASRIKKGAEKGNHLDGLYYKWSKEIAEAAVNAGLTTGIDPALALAIGIFESGFGTTETAKNKLNFWGYNYNNVTWEAGAKDFSNGTNGSMNSLEYAFTQWMTRIAENYYANGQNCLYRMYNNGGNHQYSGEVNADTTDWVVNVAYYMKAIHDAIGQTDSNMTYHSGNNNYTSIDNIAKYLYSTVEGYTGSSTGNTSDDSRVSGAIKSYNGEDVTVGSSNKSKVGTIFSSITDYGKKVLKSIWGKFYDLLFGSDDTESSTNSYAGGYYDANGNWVEGKYSGAENATNWFTTNMTKDAGSTVDVSAGYGDDPRYKSIAPYHSGIDFDTHKKVNIAVRSPINGTIYNIGHSNPAYDGTSSGGYGEFVRITDDDGLHSHMFAHLLRGTAGGKFETGQHVERGNVIGMSGTTGYSTGPHLHYEIDDLQKFLQKGTGGYDVSINPDTDYDWSKYINLDEQRLQDIKDLSDKYDADKLLTLYHSARTQYSNLERIQDSNGQKAVRENYFKYLDAIKRKFNTSIAPNWHTYGTYAPSDTDSYKNAKRLYDAYNLAIKKAEDPNYKTAGEIAVEELAQKDAEAAQQYQKFKDEEIYTGSKPISDAYDDGIYNKWSKDGNRQEISEKYLHPLTRKFLQNIHNYYMSQFSGMTDSHSIAAFMEHDPNYVSEKELIEEASKHNLNIKRFAGTPYDILNLYPNEAFHANGHYSASENDYPMSLFRDNWNDMSWSNASTFKAGVGYDVKNNIADISALNDYIRQYPYVFYDTPQYYWRGFSSSQDKLEKYNKNANGNIYELRNSVFDHPQVARYFTQNPGSNYGKWFDYTVNEVNKFSGDAWHRVNKEIDTINDHSAFYDLGSIKDLPTPTHFGTGKANNSLTNIASIQTKMKKIQSSKKKSKNQELQNLEDSLVDKVAGFVKTYKMNPLATEPNGDERAIGGFIKKPTFGRGKKPTVRKISTKNYGKSKLPTVSTVKTYTNNIVAPTIEENGNINYTKLIIAIVELLTKISDNSNKVDKIIDLLRKYGPSLGIDTSGYGKAKTGSEKKAAARHSIVRDHVRDPSWGFAAMDHMNREDTVNNFMEEVLSLARE